jgi:Na+/H+-dicarboxylate symporter
VCTVFAFFVSCCSRSPFGLIHDTRPILLSCVYWAVLLFLGYRTDACCLGFLRSQSSFFLLAFSISSSSSTRYSRRLTSSDVGFRRTDPSIWWPTCLCSSCRMVVRNSVSCHS